MTDEEEYRTAYAANMQRIADTVKPHYISYADAVAELHDDLAHVAESTTPDDMGYWMAWVDTDFNAVIAFASKHP